MDINRAINLLDRVRDLKAQGKECEAEKIRRLVVIECRELSHRPEEVRPRIDVYRSRF
jgi:hypothetical protein